MSIATWYSHQYTAWTRHRRLGQTPIFTPTETRRDMAQVNQEAQPDASNAAGKDKKPTEPLFGPSIGSVSNGPAWTLTSEKKVMTDELTPDIVNSWIEKSKEPSQPTTTLQALVNLKRPTLRLSPLSSVGDDAPGSNASEQHQHGLEFEYDCDAPKCGIYVHVHLPKSHPDAPSTSSHHPLAKLLVFETVVEGGFGNHLKLEEGALLELGRFEHSTFVPNKTGSPPAPITASTEAHATPTAAAESSLGLTTADANAGRSNPRRRFTNFHFRKRTHNHSISGPALAVVDAEPAPAQENVKAKDGKDEPEEGVKITIRLAALDEQGTELASPNEQTTYLHIVRFGQKSTEPTDGGESEDTRPWVVKVVKREATIGPHTFHLHEIFGLTSSTSHSAPPPATAPLPTTPHTYPPEEGQAQPVTVIVADDDDPQSECLLCLSSPREVVLLPCRHLVACKDCALNMVEFGAGGNITQSTEATAGGDDVTPAPAAPASGITAVASALATPPPPNNQRRKRKAKGWFCPVCRQPYTSMLRLTTSAPPVAESKEGEGSGTEDEGAPASPEQAHVLPTAEVRSGGLLGGSLRPGFLRGLSLSRTQPAADVENQVAQVRA